MAKLSIIQTNFTAGELSPRLHGRVDISRYQNGAKCLENAIIAVQGGVMRTWGTEFIQACKYANKKARLIPYIFNRAQSYMVEFGNQYCRIYKNTELLQEIESPYTENMLADINYVQGADTMFLAHPFVPIQRLRRISDTNWTLLEAPFIVKPFDENGDYPNIDLVLSSKEKGSATATLKDDFFLEADVGRSFSFAGGVAKITALTNRRLATIDILSPFSDLTLKAGTWNLQGSPLASIAVSNGTESSIVIGPSTIGWNEKPILTGQSITVGLSKNGFRPEDIGKYLKLGAGLYQITGLNGASKASASCKTTPNSKAGADPYGWSLNTNIWDDKHGYPAALTLHGQRLFCGGSTERPQTVWMSRVGEYLNFELSTDDDDAAAFTMSSDQINPIMHISQTEVPVVLTYGGEFSLTGSAAKSTITPTNINIKGFSTYGANKVRPVRIGTQLLWVQRSGKKLYAMAFNAAYDTFVSQNITVLSDHITKTGIIDMAYQQEPESILWTVRKDGQMATLTIDQEQEVLGWSRQITDGYFEAVASIPNDKGTNDDIWCIVRRTINGSNVRYIERFSADNGIYTHCSKTFTSQEGEHTFKGLKHLEGKKVDVVADGVMQQQTVKDGQITLEQKTYKACVGLPYTTTIELLNIEVQGATGTLQGNHVRNGETVLKVLDTIGCKINGDVIAFRRFGKNILDRPPEPFTGEHKMELLGWDRPLVIEQDQPLPFNLLAVIRKVSANDG